MTELHVPLFGVEQAKKSSDDYYTPPHVFEALGLEFDLDVCAPPGGAPAVPAKRFFTMADDGLSQEWEGRVWMNPPYSKPAPWVHRFMEHGHGIALIPHSKSAWHIELMASADGTASPEKYWDFLGGSIFIPVWFAAFGEECVDAISRIGTVRVRRDD